MRRIKGIKNLVVDGVQQVSSLVERAERSAGDRVVRWMSPVAPLDDVARGVVRVRDVISATTHLTIRGVAETVRVASDVGFDLASGPDGAGRDVAGARWLDVAEGAINGVVGHHLAERGNGLDLGMTLRRQGRVVPATAEALAAEFGDARARLVVFVHGLSATEWAWSIASEAFHGEPDINFGVLLERAGEVTPLYVRYNSGRHVSESGEALSELLEQVVGGWPVAVEQVVLVGHSMGGLVARSAAAQAASAGRGWPGRLTHLITLGSPHHGAPLEKLAHVAGHVLDRIDVGWTKISAEVLAARSDGIKDLRFGYTAHEEWREEAGDILLDDARGQVPLVDGVFYAALGTTLTRDPEHPLGQLIGDWLVRLPSSTGHGDARTHTIPFHSTRVIPHMTHNDLANHPAVFEAILGWLNGDEDHAGS